MASRRVLDAAFLEASIQLYEAAKAYIDCSDSINSSSTVDSLRGIPVSIKNAVGTAINNWRRTAAEALHDQADGQPPPLPVNYDINRRHGRILLEMGNLLVNALESDGATMEPKVFAHPRTQKGKYESRESDLGRFGNSLCGWFLALGRQFVHRFERHGEVKPTVSRLEQWVKTYPNFEELEKAIREGEVGILKQGWELIKELDWEVKQALKPQHTPTPTFSESNVHNLVNSGFNTNIGNGQQQNGDAGLVMTQLGSDSGLGLGHLDSSCLHLPMILLRGYNSVNVGSYNSNFGSGSQGVHMSTTKHPLHKE